MINEQDSQNNSAGSLESIGLFIWDLVKVFLIAFVIVWLLLRPFVAEPFIVSGSSMVPNFHDKEYLIVQKLQYYRASPARGDIIVFKYPNDPSQYFIKRIIGLPGEQIKVEQGHVFIQSDAQPAWQKLNEPWIGSKPVTFGKPDTVTLGSGEYYVLGDNRLQSSDSRVWGALPKDNIVGKVWLRVLPLSKLGIIKHGPQGD